MRRILQSKSKQKQCRSHKASHNGTRCGVSNPTGHPAVISACSGVTEKLTGKQKVNFNRGRKRARSSCGGDQSSVKTSHTEEVQSNSFALHSHTKAEVKIRYRSLGGWQWIDWKANLLLLGKSPAQNKHRRTEPLCSWEHTWDPWGTEHISKAPVLLPSHADLTSKVWPSTKAGAHLPLCCWWYLSAAQSSCRRLSLSLPYSALFARGRERRDGEGGKKKHHGLAQCSYTRCI